MKVIIKQNGLTFDIWIENNDGLRIRIDDECHVNLPLIEAKCRADEIRRVLTAEVVEE